MTNTEKKGEVIEKGRRKKNEEKRREIKHNSIDKYKWRNVNYI
jgi:hypothetical protein